MTVLRHIFDNILLKRIETDKEPYLICGESYVQSFEKKNKVSWNWGLVSGPLLKSKMWNCTDYEQDRLYVNLWKIYVNWMAVYEYEKGDQYNQEIGCI